MDFTTLKMNIIETTGLAKDALHIYVGVGVYILCLFMLRPILKKQGVRSFIALIIVTGVALAGEYLDNRPIILSDGIFALGSAAIKASIHDLINTCLLSYVLFALMNWTKFFTATTKAKPMILRHKKTDY